MRTPRILQSVLLVMLLISQLVLASIDPAIAAQPASTNQAIVQSALQAATSDCQTGKGFGLNAANQSLLNQLQNAAADKATIVCHDLTGKVRFLSTEPGVPVARSATLTANATPETATRNFLVEYGSLFGLTDQAQELNVMRIMAADRGYNFVRYQQVYQGIPVIAGEIIVQVDQNQQVVSAGGELLPDLKLSVTPQLTADQARDKAFAKVSREYKVDPAALTATTPELSIYDPRLLEDYTFGAGQLVWKMVVESNGTASRTELFQEFVLIDANTGSVALNFNQIAEAKNRQVCNNNIPQSSEGVCTTPVRSEGQVANSNDDVNKAYDYAGATYDFLRITSTGIAWMGRA